MNKLAFCVAVALGFSSVAASAATISLDAPGVSIPVQVSSGFESGKLTVIGPNGSVHESFLTANSHDRIGLSTSALTDGTYRYRIDIVGAEIQSTVAADAGSGRSAATQGRTAIAPVEGTFRISNGQLVPKNLVERSSSADPSNSNIPVAGPRPNDQVIAEDLIVLGRICAGNFACADGEVFGSEQLRVKGNTVRIRFEDDSTAAGFAATDWELTANEGGSGGAEQFAITDLTAATVPFKVAGAAPDNSLFISSAGRIGVGTATPALEIHVNDTDTPALRLDQNGGGFESQIWDVAGNEANFFIRDVTGGSILPFRIRPGAPQSSIDIAATGNVGIGTGSPAARLDVAGDAIVRGTLSQLSSRTAKENFELTNGKMVLAKLEKMPISTWNYRGSDAADRHLGPVAEDFHEAFGLGTSDHFVAPTDIAGVALASVKALQDEISERDQRIAQLEKRLHDLEILVSRTAR